MKKYGRYFTVEVKPTIPASIQDIGSDGTAHTAKDLLFDWAPFKLPKGGNKLIGITTIVRGIDGADQQIPMDLIFATTQRGGGDTAAGTAPVTLGTEHAAIDTSVDGQNPPYNEIIGHAIITANNFLTADVFSEGISIASTGLLTTDDVSGPIIFDSYGSLSPTVSDGSLVQPADLDDSEGMYTFYVAATCVATPNLKSMMVTTGAHGAGTANDITVGTTDARAVLAPGDVIHAHDNAVIGTVGNIPDATSIILKTVVNPDGTTTATTNTEALGSGDRIYNIHPIKLIFAFER